jgi:hypothetical protein
MKVSTLTGTKSYKLFSFPAIYTLSIYREATLSSHWHTLRYNLTGTETPPAEKNISAGIHEFQFMFWRPKLNTKKFCTNLYIFLYFFKKYVLKSRGQIYGME